MLGTGGWWWGGAKVEGRTWAAGGLKGSTTAGWGLFSRTRCPPQVPEFMPHVGIPALGECILVCHPAFPTVLTAPPKLWGLGFLLPISNASDFIPFAFPCPSCLLPDWPFGGEKVEHGSAVRRSSIC